MDKNFKSFNDALDAFNKKMKQKLYEKDKPAIMSDLSQQVLEAFAPVLEELAKNSKISKEQLIEAMREVTIAPPVVHVPSISVPEPKVTVHVKPPEVTVNIPKADQPQVHLPDILKVIGEMTMAGVDARNPFPVIMMGLDGKPMSFSQSVSMGGGGRADFFTLKDIQTSSGGSIIDQVDGALKVVGTFSATTAPFATYYASDAVGSQNIIQLAGNNIAVDQGVTGPGVQRVVQVNDVGISVNITGANVTIATALVDSNGNQYSGSNPLPTTAVASLSAATGQGDGASALRTIQAGDTVSSVFVNNPTGPGEAATALRILMAGDAVASVIVNGFLSSVAAALVDSSGIAYSGSNPLPTTASLSVPTGQGDSASALRTVQAGDAASSVNVTQFNGNTPATGLNETSAGVLRTVQMSDTVSSVYANNPSGQGDTATALRIVHAGDSGASTNIIQFNGNTPAVGQNETTAGVLRTILMSDTVSSVYVQNPVGQGDSTTALRVVHAGDVAASFFMTGVADSMTVSMARTTLPTAKTDGSDVRPMADKLGRGVTRPMQVRDLISTAYLSLSTGTEATLLAASAGNFLDLIYIMGANSSDAAVLVDIRPVTGGGVVMTLAIPANGTAGIACPVPVPQNDSGNNWTADMPDITGTTVYLTALFSKES